MSNKRNPAMKSLMCVVIGDGSVFVVDIYERKKVGHLKNMIHDAKRSIIKCDADQLTLYIAKKDGNWLKDDDPDMMMVKNGEVPKGIADIMGKKNAMNPNYRIGNPAFSFPDEDDAGDDEIHVLVNLPHTEVGAVDENSAMKEKSTAQLIKEIHEQIVQKNRENYVHSKVDSTKGKKLLQALNIKVHPVAPVPFACTELTPVPAFRWSNLTQEQQRQCYHSYVEHHIGSVLDEKKLCVFGVENGENLLTVAVPNYDIDLVGRTDILVLSDIVKTQPIHLQFLPGVRLLMEVKKTEELKTGSVYQALSELIALDLLTHDPVMALLTDLNGHWQFFWVSDKSTTIQTLVISTPAEAFHVIRTLLAQSSSFDEDIRLPCYQEPVKRRKLINMLPSVTEGGDIKESLQRMYDISSILGPDIDMARDVARQITRSIPCFSMYT